MFTVRPPNDEHCTIYLASSPALNPEPQRLYFESPGDVQPPDDHILLAHPQKVCLSGNLKLFGQRCILWMSWYYQDALPHSVRIKYNLHHCCAPAYSEAAEAVLV